jgi:hypothetical protein
VKWTAGLSETTLAFKVVAESKEKELLLSIELKQASPFRFRGGRGSDFGFSPPDFLWD